MCGTRVKEILELRAEVAKLVRCVSANSIAKVSSPSPSPSPSTSGGLFPEFPGFANTTLEWTTVILDFLARASWPLLLLFVFWTLWRKKNRGDVNKAITAALQSIRMLKIGDVEAHFTEKEAQQRLETIKSYVEKGSAEQSPSEVPGKSVQASEDSTRDETPKEQKEPSVNPVSFKSDPRMIVLEAYELLENALRGAIATIPLEDQEDYGMGVQTTYSWPPEKWSMTVLMRFATRSGLLTSSELKGLDAIRQMRNRIAHFPSGVEISEETAQEYADQCETIVSRVLDRSRRWETGDNLKSSSEDRMKKTLGGA